MILESVIRKFTVRGKKKAERKMTYSLFRRRNFCTACALQIAFGSVESGTEFSLKTVVQSIHESPWLSALTDSRLQSANTAVCLPGGYPGAYPPRNRTQRFTRRNTGDTGTVGGLSFSLCYFDTSTLPVYRKAWNFSAKPQLTLLNSLPLYVLMEPRGQTGHQSSIFDAT